MTRPVSLSVHRNNRAQREAKRVRAMLKDDVKELAALPNIAGYAVVAWDAERKSRAKWFTPRVGPVPLAVMPEHVKVTLLRIIGQHDTHAILEPFDDDGAA